MAGDPEHLDTTSDEHGVEDAAETAMWDDAADMTESDSGGGEGWEAVETPIEPGGDADIIANARRRYGSGGALLAAGMLGLDNILREKIKPDSVQVQEAPTDPIDLDAEGIRVTIDESLSVNAPALDRVPLLDTNKKRRR